MAESEVRRGLEMEVQFLKGVGPKGAATLGKLGLATVGDVLWYLPRRYDDRRDMPQLVMLRPGRAATVRGRLMKVSSKPLSGGRVLISAELEDGTGGVRLTWFNQGWVGRELKKGEGEIVAWGMVKEGMGGRLEMANPEWEWIDEDDDAEDFARIVPVYGLSEGVPQKLVRKAVSSALERFVQLVDDPMPGWLKERERLKPLAWCLRQMHQPENENFRREARRRLVFEEFYLMQLELQMKRAEVRRETGIAFPIHALERAAPGSSLFGESALDAGGGIWDEVHRMLPFELTGAQRRVVTEIWRDMERPEPMNRLVQGDVGSGKTAVAACGLLAAVRCGYQGAMMAPTEILAEQHAINLRRLFDPLGVTVALMVGKQGVRERERARKAVASGEAQIVVGTHAVIQDGVELKNLGLAVIDEQHRFGVMQRLALRTKSHLNPDVLVMTATPIPRTLTMTLYGDLDLSVIDELPPGRKAIKTHWKRASDRPSVYRTVRTLLDQGRQAYFVCPNISESEKLQTQAAEDLHFRLQKEFADLKVGLLHGQMKGAEKEGVMQEFREGRTHVLVSTTVIEVGVDVPNASVMVIEDADRFGLAQLHQLRGRVGRGESQSYCILIAEGKTEDGQRRMEVMVETTDGFRIAEEDLKLRGPGDLAGTKQSGLADFRVADLVQDSDLLEVARQAAMATLERDPGLTGEEHAGVLARVSERRREEALVTVS